MEISNKIIALRELYDLTQVQLGSIAGVSGAAVSAWELGDRSPKLGSIKKICNHFQIDLSRFVDDENNYYGAPEQTINLTPDSEGEILSPARQALLDAVSNMDDDTASAFLDVVNSVKKLRGEEPIVPPPLTKT